MGMILGSGCASGTFVGMGGGFIKSYVVLLFFIIGATIFALNPFYNFWSKLPKTAASVQIHFSITLVILIALYGITLAIDYFKARNQYQKGPKKEEIDQINTLIPSENEKMVNDHMLNGVGFVGSIAYYYRPILEEAMKAEGMPMGTVLKDPVDGLKEYHKGAVVPTTV